MHRIKVLAQKTQGSTGLIEPGFYEYLEQEVLDYQKQLNNLVEVSPEKSNIDENSYEVETKKTYKKKIENPDNVIDV